MDEKFFVASCVFTEEYPELSRADFERTKFCGYSLYQPQPPRNPKLAPKRFLKGLHLVRLLFEP